MSTPATHGGTSPPGLGPHCVGRRVVVRRVLHDETGPSGGPAMTDLLGVMESWAEGRTTVRAESGEVTTIALADIVSGKPVPPRPSPRQRVDPAVAERRACAGWPATVTERLGEWVLRASPGFGRAAASARANSVLAVGDPGVPLEEALARVRDFYVRHGLSAWAQVVVDSAEQHQLEDAEWVPARPEEGDVVFELASVSAALRTVRRLGAPEREVAVAETTEQPGDLAVALVNVPPDEADTAGTASTAAGAGEALGGQPGGVPGSEPDEPRDRALARGRAAYHDDWLGITDLWVDPSRRRGGLALLVLEALLEWGAEHGARTAYLQVLAANEPALGLYERAGFVPHHTYRYLRAPE